MTRVLVWLCAAMTILAASQAQAESDDSRDVMGGGPNFRGGGYGYGGGSPVARSTVMLQTANCPWPPDCFLCRPSAFAVAVIVSR